MGPWIELALASFRRNWMSIRFLKCAGIAQLVEHNLAKVGVASSSLVSRSRFGGNVSDRCGWVAEWLCSGLQSRGRRFDSDPSLCCYILDIPDLKFLSVPGWRNR
jgi:hypothetical protein